MTCRRAKRAGRARLGVVETSPVGDLGRELEQAGGRMEAKEAKQLIDELAGRPSAKSWRWIQQALVELPEGALADVAAHADVALARWPDALREGKPWHKGSRFMQTPLWDLVRALTNEGHLHPTPSMREGGPPSRLRVLRLSHLRAQGVEVLERWAGTAHGASLEVRTWKECAPGLATRLIDALDPSAIRELRLVDQGDAMPEVVRRLASTEWPALRELALSPLTDEHIAVLVDARAQLRHVEGLSVDLRGASEGAAAELMRALGPQLRALSLTSPLGASLASEIGEHARSLGSLQARFTQGALAALCAPAAGSSGLDALSLEYGSETDADECASLAASAPRLRSLAIVLGASIDDAALAALADLSALEALSLEQCAFGDEGAEAFAARSRATLRELSVRLARSLTDRGVRALASAPALRELASLRLRETGVGDEGARAIAASLGALRELDLSYGDVGIEGLRAILESRVAERLESLEFNTPLDRTKRIGDEGAELVAGCRALTSLRRLSLAAQDMDYDVVIERFSASPALAGLEELELGDNPGFLYDDETLLALREGGLTKLREVLAAPTV